MAEAALGHIKQITFDFDGVLADSAEIKTEAFKDLYLDMGSEVAEAMYQHHLIHPGVPRMDKIRWLEGNVLNREATQAELQARADKFGTLVETKVIASDDIPGARQFLELMAGGIPLAVASATPTNELLRIVAARGLTNYFDRIYGSPTSKSEAIKEMLTSHQVAPTEAAMIGDALSDYRAAHQCGVHFIGVLGRDGTHPFVAGTTVIEDLSELQNALLSISS